MGQQRYDILLVPEDLNSRISPGMGEAILRNLCVGRVVRPVDEAIADTWVEVYMEPGPSAHEPFLVGANTAEEAIFKEAVVRFGTKPVTLPYGEEKTEVTFYLEFRGCLFKDVLGPFKQRFQDVMYKRPTIYEREHTGLPEHLTVPEGEEPKEKKKRSGNLGGQAGTRIEEF